MLNNCSYVCIGETCMSSREAEDFYQRSNSWSCNIDWKAIDKKTVGEIRGFAKTGKLHWAKQYVYSNAFGAHSNSSAAQTTSTAPSSAHAAHSPNNNSTTLLPALPQVCHQLPLQRSPNYKRLPKSTPQRTLQSRRRSPPLERREHKPSAQLRCLLLVMQASKRYIYCTF